MQVTVAGCQLHAGLIIDPQLSRHFKISHDANDHIQQGSHSHSFGLAFGETMDVDVDESIAKDTQGYRLVASY